MRHAVLVAALLAVCSVARAAAPTVVSDETYSTGGRFPITADMQSGGFVCSQYDHLVDDVYSWVCNGLNWVSHRTTRWASYRPDPNWQGYWGSTLGGQLVVGGCTGSIRKVHESMVTEARCGGNAVDEPEKSGIDGQRKRWADHPPLRSGGSARILHTAREFYAIESSGAESDAARVTSSFTLAPRYSAIREDGKMTLERRTLELRESPVDGMTATRLVEHVERLRTELTAAPASPEREWLRRASPDKGGAKRAD